MIYRCMLQPGRRQNLLGSRDEASGAQSKIRHFVRLFLTLFGAFGSNLSEFLVFLVLVLCFLVSIANLCGELLRKSKSSLREAKLVGTQYIQTRGAHSYVTIS